MVDCVFCDLTQFREAEVCIENAFCPYASTRDPRDPPDVLPGCGVIFPLAHRLSPFEFTPEEWAATHELLIKAKAAQDERLAPDGYMLVWNCFSEHGQPPHNAHLHVVPRFDDEPLADRGGRSAIKVPENRRPNPSRPGNGRAQSWGPVGTRAEITHQATSGRLVRHREALGAVLGGSEVPRCRLLRVQAGPSQPL